MYFNEFKASYDKQEISEGDLILVVDSTYFAIGTLESISDKKSKNSLEAYNPVYIKTPVYLKRNKPDNKTMQQIEFTGDNISELSNRENWHSYFITEDNKTLPEIFEKQVTEYNMLNNMMKPISKDNFKKIINYLENTDEITDEGILGFLKTIPKDIYNKS